MTKPTMREDIAELRHQNTALQRLHDDDLKHQQWQTTEINRLRERVKELEVDKAWLRNMHSQVLQATHEMFRNR